MSLARAEKAEAAIRKAYEQFNAGDIGRAKKTLLAEKPASLAHPVGKTLAGLIARAEGRPKEALKAFDEALVERPGDPNLMWLRGAVIGDLGRPELGLAEIEAALARRAAMPKARFERGRMLMKLGRPREALDAFDAAIEQVPAFPEALHERGNALKALDQHDHALTSYQLAFDLRPDDVEIARARAAQLLDLFRLDEALAALDAILKQSPDDMQTRVFRVEVLIRLDRLDDALAEADRVARIPGGRARAEWLRGHVLEQTPDRARALQHFERAVTAGLTTPVAYLHRGFMKLALGRWPEAWPDYEHRHEDSPKEIAPMMMAIWPKWRGEDPTGKRILVVDEQGLGDAIQFCRYLPLLADRGARIGYLIKPRLIGLFSGLDPRIDLIPEIKGDEAFDLACPLLSLPGLMGATPDTVPASVPYFTADPARAARWGERIGSHGFRIGVVWQGNPDPIIDHGRSYPLAALAPIAALPGVRLIALQKNFGLDQLDALPAPMRVETLGEDFDTGPHAFLDTAAAMANLDLVITSDTSVAHLAGALGRPVFVALKQVADWRWLDGRDDSPFYPTMRLFRQATRGDWGSVVAAMTPAVAERIAAMP